MLENFHLATIVREGAQASLRQVPLQQSLQDNLGETWEEQYLRFTENIEELDFDAGYTLEAHERFRLNDYVPPEWLADETSQTIHSLNTLRGSLSELIDSIVGMVGMARDSQGQEVMLFQNFTRSRVIRPDRLLLFENNAYVSPERPGLTLDIGLSAVYLPDRDQLLFKSFRTVNTFLPLLDFYKEATEENIREMLSHGQLMAEDLDTSVSDANQWFGKRIAMLRDSGILDKFSISEIEARSVGHSVPIEVVNEKIVFPSDKSAAKRLLQFLVEELYKGPITDTLYETNSKRRAD